MPRLIKVLLDLLEQYPIGIRNNEAENTIDNSKILYSEGGEMH